MASTAAAAKILQDEKDAHAAKCDVEPCTNVHCTYSGCMCGRKCGCNIPDTKKVWIQQNRRGDWLTSCDPCQESWKAAAKKKQNGDEEETAAASPNFATKLFTCLFPWMSNRDEH